MADWGKRVLSPPAIFGDGFASQECESFLTLSLFLNGICAEGEKAPFFPVYLQISCPVSLCLQKSKFNTHSKRKTAKEFFHDTK